MDHQAGLFAHHFDDARVGVAQARYADAGDEIQVPLAGQIVHIAAFAARQDQRIAGIILEQIIAFQIHD